MLAVQLGNLFRRLAAVAPDLEKRADVIRTCQRAQPQGLFHHRLTDPQLRLRGQLVLRPRRCACRLVASRALLPDEAAVLVEFDREQGEDLLIGQRAVLCEGEAVASPKAIPVQEGVAVPVRKPLTPSTVFISPGVMAGRRRFGSMHRATASPTALPFAAISS
jgi:hypothetical protein